MVSLRWHCDSIYPIFILVLSVFRCAEGCWGKTAPNYGDMTGDYDLLAGSDLVLNCTLNFHSIQLDPQKNHTHFVNSSSLVFKKGSRISAEYIRRLDPLTAQLRIPNATEADSGIYHCKVLVPDVPGVPVVCSSKVSVGYPPRPVTNFSCISRNFENLTCTWDVESSGVQTKYTLYNNHFLSTYFRNPSLQHCPEETANSTFCQWRDDTDPPYQTSGKILTFVVQGNNSLGSSSDTFTVNHYEIVIPNSPEMLTVVQIGKQSLLLHWRPPTKLAQMKSKPALQYEMWIQELSKDPAEKRVIDVGNDTNSYTVSGLIPFVKYNISLRCRSNYTTKNNMWSSTVSVTVRTKANVPDVVPDIIPEAFELHYYDDYRTATLYWKPIPEKHFNGESFQYHIVCFSNATSEDFIAPVNTKNTTSTLVNFENLQKNITYFFRIYSSNKEGLSTDFKVITVDNQKKLPPGPVDIKVISHDPGHYELSWFPPRKSSIIGYTVLWCSSLKPWRSRCDGPIQWLKSNSTMNNISLTLTDSTTNFQFAVVANMAHSSSGMLWATCVVPFKAPLGKIDYVIAEQKTSTSLKVIWRLNCAAQKEVVRNFEIAYCKQNKDEICRERESVTIDDQNAESYLLHNLHPYSNYSIVLRAFNHAGVASEDSDMRFQTTLPGAPSDSPRDIKVIPKENASLQIRWQPPAFPNGLITHYNLYYNEGKEKLTVNGTAQDSYELEIHRLQFYTNYSIRIEACFDHDCSPVSEPVVALTDVGVPSAMDPPRVETINSTHLKISWTTPAQPNGPINFYDVRWTRPVEENDTVFQDNVVQKIIAIGLSVVVELECTELEDTGLQFLFFVRAANTKDGDTLYGAFSESTKTQACIMTQGVAMIIGIAIGGTLALAIFLLFICKFIKWMSDKIHQVKSITVRLPKGLEAPETNPLKNYESFKNGLSQLAPPVTGIERLSYVIDDNDNKNRHGSGSSQFSNSSAEELIYKNGKCTKFTRKPSGESSGCSSMSSSATTTRVHLSSDSGTESDFAIPPSPDFFLAEQNAHSNHKPALPILMEVHDLQGQEPVSDNEKSSYIDKQVNNYTNFMNGVVLKVDQPYSKFGVNPNSSAPWRVVNPLVFYSSNLANSEPSVFDADYSATRGQVLPPYSKIGLAKSTTDILGIPAIAREMGYSKFGLSAKQNYLPSNQGGMPTVEMIMVEGSQVRNPKQWNEVKDFLQCHKPENGDNVDRNSIPPYLARKLNPEIGIENGIDSGYIKFGLSKNLGKYPSPGYISLQDVQNLKTAVSPDIGDTPDNLFSNEQTGEEVSVPLNYMVPFWAIGSDPQIENLVNAPQKPLPENVVNTTCINSYPAADTHCILENPYLCSELANPLSSDITTIFSVRPKSASSLHPTKECSLSNVDSSATECAGLINKCSPHKTVTTEPNSPSLPPQGSLVIKNCSPHKMVTVEPIVHSIPPTAKINGYVPLSHLSNPVQDRTSSHVPNAVQHRTAVAPHGDFQCNDHVTPSNKGDLILRNGEEKNSKCHTDSFLSPVIRPHDQNVSHKTDSPTKFHLQNGVSYINGSLNYILTPLPKMESEICEV